MKNNLNRRNLFKLGAAAIVSIPVLRVGNLFAETAATATEELAWDACPIVVPEKIVKKLAKEKSKTKLAFVANATTSTHKNYKDGAACGNCKFYKTKVKDNVITGEIGGYAKCTMLANKYVNRCGWCKSYKQADDKYAIYKYLKKEEA